MRRSAAPLLVLAFAAGFGLSALDVHAQTGDSAPPPAILASGGPDGSGYTFRDNNPVTGGCGYDFINIATTGTNIGTGDDSIYTGIPIGFTFSYYGANQTAVNVSTNGFMAFGTSGGGFTNQCPMPTTSNDLQISPLWDDLYVFSPSSLVYQTVGTTPNRKFIVQWNNVGFCCTSPPSGVGMTFQVQMWEGSNIIAFMYSDIQQSTRTQGNEATVGIDGPGTTNFLQYLCNGSGNYPLVNNRAVYFLPSGVTGCAAATPTPVPTATPIPGPVGGLDVGDQVAADSLNRATPAGNSTQAPLALGLALLVGIAGLLFIGWHRR